MQASNSLAINHSIVHVSSTDLLEMGNFVSSDQVDEPLYFWIVLLIACNASCNHSNIVREISPNIGSLGTQYPCRLTCVYVVSNKVHSEVLVRAISKIAVIKVTLQRNSNTRTHLHVIGNYWSAE